MDMTQSAKQQASSHADDMNSSRDPNASFSQQRDQLAGAAKSKANEASQNAPDVDQDEAKNRVRGKAEDLKNRIPEEHRQKMSSAVNQTKDVVNDAFPEERRDQFIYRLKKVSVPILELHVTLIIVVRSSSTAKVTKTTWRP